MSKVKISAMTELAAADVAAGDMIPIIDVSEPLAADQNKKVDLRALKPYKVYTALLTQAGTDAPVATVLENTFDGIPVWSRVDVGYYKATLVDAFTINKTIARMNQESLYNLGDLYSLRPASSLDNDIISLYTSLNGAESDDIISQFTKVFIEIRVYD